METIEIDKHNTEFQNALNLIQFTRNSVFLTGKAGTGKSTLLKYICNHTSKKYVVLAPTGVAAINVGGSTLHSFFKIPFHPILPDDPRFHPRRIRDYLKYKSTHCKLIQEVELIIIDEISMVRADIIDFIDKILRIYSRRMREPFGGKQILFVGDIFQLEPVVKNDEWDILRRFYPTPYFFAAKVFNEMKLASIELKKVYRQKDLAFIAVLDHIRHNQAGPADLQLLNTRVETSTQETKQQENLCITLATRRDNVDYINRKELSALKGNSTIFRGEIRGEFPESSLPTQIILELKEGAQIIFIKNDPDKRWVNGSLGIISHINPNGQSIDVILESGNEVTVTREQWSNVKYTYNEQEKKIEEEELGVFIQYPLKLAWAITIHKSQGLTFRKVIIDFTGGVFAGGQAYVALSRCTSLDGIVLKKPISQSDIFVRPEILQFARQFNNHDILEQALKGAEADIAYNECVKAFDQGQFTLSLQHFFKAIHCRYDIEKPSVKKLIVRKLQIINRLKEENARLKSEMNSRQEQLNTLAKEFYDMGNTCITQAHNTRAALANYDKALSLNPAYLDAWIRKGITLQSVNDMHEALKCFNKALDLAPYSFKAIYQRGKHHLLCGNIAQALSDLDKSVSIKPEHAKAHKLFGDALSRNGQEEEAAIQWSIAESLMKDKNKS